jgi:predicted dehydrogenase
MPQPNTRQQAVQMDHFARCILEDRATPVPGEMGRRDVAIIEAIYESARTKRRVTL